MSQERTRSQNFFLILILGILNALTPFTIDMYLPAFPEIARDLQSSISHVSLTVSVYFIGFAFGQVLYGPLLDRFGRKRPIYVGLLIYLAATIGCQMAQTVDALLICRLISALGGCVASVGTTAMVRDYFPAKDSAKVFSLLMLVLSVSPLLAPTAGSLVILHWHWRTIFTILAVFAIVDLILVRFFLPPGHTGDTSVSLKPRPILANFKSIISEKQFAVYTFAGSFSFASLFVYVAGSPAIFMDGFHTSPQVYGAIFAFLAVGMIGGGQLNLLLTRRYSHQQIFKTALALQAIVGIVFFIGSMNGGYSLGLTIAFLFVLLSCSGITYPNAAALALAPFSKNVGSASALLGFLQLGSGATLSAVLGLFETKGNLPTAATMMISSVLGLAILTLGQRSIAAGALNQASE